MLLWVVAVAHHVLDRAAGKQRAKVEEEKVRVITRKLPQRFLQRKPDRQGVCYGRRCLHANKGAREPRANRADKPPVVSQERSGSLRRVSAGLDSPRRVPNVGLQQDDTRLAKQCFKLVNGVREPQMCVKCQESTALEAASRKGLGTPLGQMSCCT